MAKIEFYSRKWYPCCATAKPLLRNREHGYEEIDVSSDATREQEKIERSQRRSLPQIFIDKPSRGWFTFYSFKLNSHLACLAIE